MLRLWQLMWYFTRPDRPTEQNAPLWYTNGISRSSLWLHLAHDKHFCEDWRSTIREWYYRFRGRRPMNTTEHEMRWARSQKQIIDDLIDKALHDGYLEISKTSSSRPTSSEIFLKTNWKGRDFLKPLPFFNALLKESGYLYSFIFGVGGTLLLTFSGKIIGFLAALIKNFSF
ncbi:hypothetical protein HY412_00425 [Candidatus Kaiserbacteria bacterium]|nr:hypothetical protein [Candidatus Kaiserbacteria bacterium]